MRVAIYGRVSTSHQVDHQTLEQQLERLTAHVGAHAAEDWVLDSAHVFRDDGHSGAVLARPGLDRLRDAVKGREVDRVLITAPDRLAKLRAGLLLPWTYAPYGYRLHPDRPRDPRGVTTDPAEAAIVAELFAMYLEPGASLMQLALHLDARGVPTPSGMSRWSSPTIRGILRNPTYTGQVYAQRTRYRAPTHRRSATHLIGRSHGTAVPQPADTWILVGQVPAPRRSADRRPCGRRIDAPLWSKLTRRHLTVKRLIRLALAAGRKEGPR
jgi:hypothetical protein